MEWGKAFQHMHKWPMEQRCIGELSVKALLELVSAENIKAALRRLKADTSTGLCGASLRELRHAPTYVLQVLVDLLNEIVKEIIGPSSCMEVVLHLIHKKSAGFRTICTLPSFGRILFHAWDRLSNMGYAGSTGRGHSLDRQKSLPHSIHQQSSPHSNPVGQCVRLRDSKL